MRLCISLLLALSVAACGGSAPKPATTTTANVGPQPLSFLAAERVIVLPAFALSVAPELSWGASVGRPSDVLRTLDADIATTLQARGLRQRWVLPDQLKASYTRNASYATDPYALAEDPLRSRSLLVGTRLREPLASQLRTMIALHENSRYVLAPVELRFERASGSAASGRAALRLVLIDPRFSEVRWIGDVTSDPATTFSPTLTATIAQRLVNLVVEP